jgi:hypothetical protein
MRRKNNNSSNNNKNNIPPQLRDRERRETRGKREKKTFSSL